MPYHNSYVDIDGRKLASVSGGTRWGGGVWINAMDMARFGYLWLRGGKWGDKQIVPPAFVKEALTPGGAPNSPATATATCGGSTRRARPCVGLPTNAFSANGAGSNTITVSPDHDLVVVWRWHRGNYVAPCWCLSRRSRRPDRCHPAVSSSSATGPLVTKPFSFIPSTPVTSCTVRREADCASVDGRDRPADDGARHLNAAFREGERVWLSSPPRTRIAELQHAPACSCPASAAARRRAWPDRLADRSSHQNAISC